MAYYFVFVRAGLKTATAKHNTGFLFGASVKVVDFCLTQSFAEVGQRPLVEYLLLLWYPLVNSLKAQYKMSDNPNEVFTVERFYLIVCL